MLLVTPVKKPLSFSFSRFNVRTEMRFKLKTSVWGFEKVSRKRCRGTQLFQTAILLLLMLVHTMVACCQKNIVPVKMKEQSVMVPLGGNTWPSSENGGGAVDTTGIVNWTSAAVSFTTYVRLAKSGTLKMWLNTGKSTGKSILGVTILNQEKKVAVNNTTRAVYVGEWTIKDTGYVAIKLSGLSKTGSRFPSISAMKIGGTAIDGNAAFVKNNDGNFFYWGRRGPSVHLSYEVPQTAKAEWFYNEVTVPEGNDVIGSYFMADGFAEGYFGMQVNSATERRILFSVWSPFPTDDPASIPNDQKIRLLKKGADVHAGEFGNEGAGGQSYLRYAWKAGNTYRFLLHAVPGPDSTTTYTAYFFAPEEKAWHLVASFRRPHTYTYLKRLHSFLENFEPEQGKVERRVLFTNQWICDTQGNWTELTKARFTGDNTAVKGFRKDYGGGLQGSAFYLRNCGFFTDYTPLLTWFEHPPSGTPPVVDFTTLP